MKRFALVLGVVLLLVVAAVVYFVRFRLDGVVKNAIERYGSEVTQTDVRVEGVHIDLRAGRGTIRGIAIANPPGFSSAPAVTFSEIRIGLEPTSVRSNPIVVDEIHVGAPRVNVEFNGEGRMNVDQLRRNIDSYESRSRSASEPARSAGGGERSAEEPTTRLRVRELTIDEGTIRVDASALGRDREPDEVRLGSVELSQLGRDAGATPGEVGEAVADALLERTLVAVAGSQARRALEDLGGEIGKKLGNFLEKGFQR
jgi:uncharacterized protein involved in outer membrane biogenesis